MRNSMLLDRTSSPPIGDISNSLRGNSRILRQLMIGAILILALFAFEMFNFDTTRYALQSLLGDIRFLNLAWATILAVAFCAIDFAGLARLFTPERGGDEPKEIWYLTGAWLLGATMNAVMTWWAVSSVLVNNPVGNEVLSHEQLIEIVPVFVAVLVWLTRILFIGAITIAGEKLMHSKGLLANRRSTKGMVQSERSVREKRQPDRSRTNGSTRHEAMSSKTPALKRAQEQTTRVNRRPVRPVTQRQRLETARSAQAGGRRSR